MPENQDTRNNNKPSGFLGLSQNLWRLAIVMAISQFSIGLWKWEFSIFLRTLIEPWQMGLVFSSGTFAGIVGGLASGMIADRIGRRKTLALSFGRY
ncbi:MAG: hypothetical protein P1Q69_02985 [Candidatus Thorarchaeota archaeon]|nr:hypothetical protein [Candidatus Thorarchaeota archaeon]